MAAVRVRTNLTETVRVHRLCGRKGRGWVTGGEESLCASRRLWRPRLTVLRWRPS